MNLINDKWIPVKNSKGEQVKIAPWQITEENYILSAPRADFNGALYQFLIGLLQTTLGMELNNHDDWKKLYDSPPSIEDLKISMGKVSHAFNLDGDGPRFMQERINVDNEVPIQRLLLDAPGENTLKQNRDFFISEKSIKMCASCVTLALFNMQNLTHYDGGGQGPQRLACMRGGGALTTIIINETLWGNLWLNVLNTKDFFGNNKIDNKFENIFPWLENKRTSGKEAKTQITTPEHVSLLQMFWGQPRRIELLKYDSLTPCGICGEKFTDAYYSFKTIGDGVKYNGWEHVLSPHSKNDKENKWDPIKASQNSLRYSEWIGLLHENEIVRCSKTINRLHQLDIKRSVQFRLKGFGYHTNKANVLAWSEGTIPIFCLGSETIYEDYRQFSERLIHAAELIANKLEFSLKNALTGNIIKKDGKIDWDYDLDKKNTKTRSLLWWNAKIKLSIEAQFWSETESMFYSRQRDILEALKDDNSESLYQIIALWHKDVCKTTLIIFDRWTEKGGLNRSRIREVSYARSQLKSGRTGIYGENITDEILRLPKKQEV